MFTLIERYILIHISHAENKSFEYDILHAKSVQKKELRNNINSFLRKCYFKSVIKIHFLEFL